MTAYFDTMRQRITDAHTYEDLVAVEADLVKDCATATQMPGFPPQHVNSVLQTILRLAVEALPEGAVAYEDPSDTYARRLVLLDLESCLHSAFHSVVTDGGLSDSPVAYVSAAYCRAENTMTALAEISLDNFVDWAAPEAQVRLFNYLFTLQWPDGSRAGAWLVDGKVTWGLAGERVVDPVTRMCNHPLTGPTIRVRSLLAVAQALGLVTQRDNPDSAQQSPQT